MPPRSVDTSTTATFPLSGTHILFLDVDSDGRTATGETFGAEIKPYRGHQRVEDVVIRYPNGQLKLVQRIIPARQLV